MWGLAPRGALGGLCPLRPAGLATGPGLRPGVNHGSAHRAKDPRLERTRVIVRWYYVVRRSALALLVTRVVTDDHDAPVAPDDPALVADLLDARLDLHRCALLVRAPPGRAATWAVQETDGFRHL